jgi:ABC-type branched-subunit amino acid transport system ATPase component
VHALSDVSFSTEKGEILGIIGPNGSGKTTLVNVISGVIAPTSGSVTLGSATWERRASHHVARAGIARTFQTVRLFQEMTVLENVEVAASCSPHFRGLRGARKATRETIAMLGLEDHANAVTSTLAYGRQRRVELARAAVGKPHFLLLDEPAAGLNETESDELLETLVRLRDAVECGVLLIDHDLRLIMRGTDRIHVLKEGRTLADGTPEAIRHDPRVIAAYLGTEALDASVPPSAT